MNLLSSFPARKTKKIFWNLNLSTFSDSVLAAWLAHFSLITNIYSCFHFRCYCTFGKIASVCLTRLCVSDVFFSLRHSFELNHNKLSYAVEDCLFCDAPNNLQSIVTMRNSFTTVWASISCAVVQRVFGWRKFFGYRVSFHSVVGENDWETIMCGCGDNVYNVCFFFRM